MSPEKYSTQRSNLLAYVADMYYINGLDQSAIAREVGVTRSMVSRMLTEARKRGIVEIKVNWPIHPDHDLEEAIKSQYGIPSVLVVTIEETRRDKLIIDLGNATVRVLNKYLNQDPIIGIAWGTTISAIVDAVQPQTGIAAKVVQLVGAQGAKSVEYDGHMLVQRLVEKLGGEGYYINAPYLCQSAEITQSLRETRGIKEAIEMCTQIQLALLGIGTTKTEYSSHFLSGLLTSKELNTLRKNGAIGDIAGNYYKEDGSPYEDDFLRRMINIRWEDLKKVPIRIGVAGGPGKVDAIAGALRTGLITHLITDNITARIITK